MKTRREIVALVLSVCVFLSMLVDLPLVSADYTVEEHYMPSESDDLAPVCAMKTKVNGFFYVPAHDLHVLEIELLFSDASLEGDQSGGTSPYVSISHWPNGNVDLDDVLFVGGKFGSTEGAASWDYMADIAPDRKIDLTDYLTVCINYGHVGNYPSLDLAGVEVVFDTGHVLVPDSYGFITIPFSATGFTVYKNSTPTGALITFHGPLKPPIAYSTTFEFSVPDDGGLKVWYYVLVRIYVPAELAGNEFHLFPEQVDDWIRNVRINNQLKYSGGHPECLPPASVSLGVLGQGYHLLEFELGEQWAYGILRFHVATGSGQYAWLSRFRTYVPNYSPVDIYEYTVKTNTYFPGGDFFLGGYADKFIYNVHLDAGSLWSEWMWDIGASPIYGWGDGFMYPLGTPSVQAHTVSFTFGNNGTGLLDFQYISRTSQPQKIGQPKFYASANINNLGSYITLNNAKIYGGSQWAGNPGVSGRNFTILTTYNVSYNDGGDWFNTLLAIEIGNWFATWELGASQPPDVAIPLNFTVANLTSNLRSGLILSTLFYWEVWLKDYTMDIYSFQNLPIKGIEQAGEGQSNGIIVPGYTIALDFAGTTIMTAGALIPGGLIIGSVVGLGVTGVAAILNYVQGQHVSGYSETVKENNLWQLTANSPIKLYPDTNSSSSESQSDLVFIKFQPNAGYHCGLTKVVLKGNLVVLYHIVPYEGWPVTWEMPIGDIEITLCVPWFIWSLT